MSIISKLNYLKDTKEAIRTALNNLGAELSTSATFRSYATFIDTLYEGLPKETATGSIFTINNTKAGKMTVSLKGGSMYQLTGADPSLASPKKLFTTTGNNTIVICGKNLFNKNDTARIIDNATFSNNMITYNANQKVLYIRCKPSTQYTIQKLATSGLQSRFSVASAEAIDPENYYDTNLYSVTTNSTASSITYTTDSDARYLVVLFYNSSNTQYTYQEILDSIQIEYGASASTYEAFKGNYYTVNLGSLLVRGIGNFNDYIYKSGSNWYIHRTIVSQSPSANYNFVKNSSQPISQCTLFYYNNVNAYNDGNSMSKNVLAMSTMFKGIGYRDMTFDDGNTQYGVCLQCDNANNHRVWLRVPQSIATTVEEIKALMTQYQPTIYFVAIEESQSYDRIRDDSLIAQLEAITNAMSQSGMTNILQYDSEVPFLMDLTYLKGDE